MFTFIKAIAEIEETQLFCGRDVYFVNNYMYSEVLKRTKLSDKQYKKIRIIQLGRTLLFADVASAAATVVRLAAVH